MLNDNTKYNIWNLGLSGRQVTKSCYQPYWDTLEFKSNSYKDSNIVLLMLGTNDHWCWPGDDQFVSDYKDMVKFMMELPKKPQVYVMVPPPIMMSTTGTGWINKWAHRVNVVLPPLIPRVAKEAGLPDDHVIDIFSKLGGAQQSKPEKFCDGRLCDMVHPNHSGYLAIALEVYKVVFMKDQKP